MQVEQLGVSALVFSARHERRSDVEATARVLAQLESGSLRADDKIDIATRLRREKPADPVPGVISASLYDSVGDTDSIRRMAYFYAQCAQPIPCDIALLGQLQGRWSGGELWVTVPSVARSTPPPPQ